MAYRANDMLSLSRVCTYGLIAMLHGTLAFVAEAVKYGKGCIWKVPGKTKTGAQVWIQLDERMHGCGHT
jgi:hypothetical protein